LDLIFYNHYNCSLYGGNIHTGLEDVLYYQKGEMVKSNAKLVERMVRLAKELGREPAIVDEAKEKLGLK